MMTEAFGNVRSAIWFHAASQKILPEASGWRIGTWCGSRLSEQTGNQRHNEQNDRNPE
jgi:hypothetical protein